MAIEASVVTLGNHDEVIIVEEGSVVVEIKSLPVVSIKVPANVKESQWITSVIFPADS